MAPAYVSFICVNRTALVGLSACLLLASCATSPVGGSASATGSAGASKPAASASGAVGTVSCEYRVTSKAAKPVDPPSSQAPTTGTAVVTLNFAAGPVQVTLDRAAAPCTAHSFESLASQGYFNGSRCHRLGTQGLLMLQCGDPTGTGRGTPGYSFDDELAATKTYDKGVVAMANAGPNTNGGQFFLVFGDTELEPHYTIFGHMDAQGVEVVAGLAKQGTDNAEGPGVGKPLGDTTITAAAMG